MAKVSSKPCFVSGFPNPFFNYFIQNFSVLWCLVCFLGIRKDSVCLKEMFTYS